SRSMAIDTEPVFSPDGKWLYFTSDRGGNAQIYRQPVEGGKAERVTFNGNYAVSPVLNPDGTHLSYITRVEGRYRVAIMEIATGQEMILTHNQFDESPCFSPNGRMIVYASERGRKGVLGTVSVDGAVTSWLTAAAGDIREPTWGPLLQ
ncbi:MAG: Tol-Pal system protein TolB, partial [Duodenibacillus sp.]|nr:Tol-Pal system protein TolB [Duodenibacillus sp.]